MAVMPICSSISGGGCHTHAPKRGAEPRLIKLVEKHPTDVGNMVQAESLRADSGRNKGAYRHQGRSRCGRPHKPKRARSVASAGPSDAEPSGRTTRIKPMRRISPFRLT